MQGGFQEGLIPIPIPALDSCDCGTVFRYKPGKYPLQREAAVRILKADYLQKEKKNAENTKESRRILQAL